MELGLHSDFAERTIFEHIGSRYLAGGRVAWSGTVGKPANQHLEMKCS